MRRVPEMVLGVRTLLLRMYKTRRLLFVFVCLGVVLGLAGATYGAYRAIETDMTQGSGNVAEKKDDGKVAGASQQVRKEADAVASQPSASQSPATGTDKTTAPTSKKSGSSYPAGSNTAVPRYGVDAACPAEFQPPNPLPPGGWTGPPKIMRSMAAQTVTIPNGQDSGRFTFTAPDNPIILYVFAWSSYPTSNGVAATLVSGVGQRTVTISVKPGSGNPMGQDHVMVNSACYTYDIPITYYRESPPALQFTLLDYVEASNSLNYAANGPVKSVQITYSLDGCDASTGACYGTDTVNAMGASGVIPFDPLFPQLDAYFASHTATAITLTITPIAAGYTSVPITQMFPL